MDIQYKTKSIKRVCTDAEEARKKLGPPMAEKISQRIEEINSADSVEMMIKYGIGRCHGLKGGRKGQYAVDLVQPHRLVFEKIGNQIQVVKIVEIIDYH